MLKNSLLTPLPFVFYKLKFLNKYKILLLEIFLELENLYVLYVHIDGWIYLLCYKV